MAMRGGGRSFSAEEQVILMLDLSLLLLQLLLQDLVRLNSLTNIDKGF